MTGSRLRSLMNSMMRCFNSCVELTRMWRSTERAALEKKPSTRVEPGTVFGSEHKGEAAVRLSGQPGLGLPRDVRRVIVQNDLDRRCGWVGRVENFEELDELATAMAVLDERVHSTGKQIDAGH